MKLSRIDVVVAGAGASGLMAAIAAADEGAKVLQIEKTDKLGGSFWLTGGSSVGAATKLQFESGVMDDTPARFFSDCMQESRAREVCDSDVLWYYCQHSGFIIDWLDSLGAYPKEFRVPRESIYGEPWTVKRAYFTDTGIQGGDKYLKVLMAEHEKRVKRGDIEVLMNTAITALLKSDGKITGVKTRGADSKEKEYRAKAVILCTGGFASNQELVRKYKWPDVKEMISISLPSATGDGLVMCDSAGAKLVNMGQDMAPYTGGVPDPQKPGRRIANTNMDKYPGPIWVNLKGKRIVNEDGGVRMPKTRLAIEASPEMKAIVILDKKIKDENVSIFYNMFDPGKTWKEFEQMAAEGVLIKQANTIEELATKLGIDPVSLKKTVTTYNGYVDAGKDPDFGRQELKYKIENPPFYGFVVLPTVVMTSGGPAHNDRQQVIDTTGKIIPGLYVAGELAGYKGFGTGAGNTGCFVFGKRAGEMAARYVLEIPV